MCVLLDSKVQKSQGECYMDTQKSFEHLRCFCGNWATKVIYEIPFSFPFDHSRDANFKEFV